MSTQGQSPNPRDPRSDAPPLHGGEARPPAAHEPYEEREPRRSGFSATPWIIVALLLLAAGAAAFFLMVFQPLQKENNALWKHAHELRQQVFTVGKQRDSLKKENADLRARVKALQSAQGQLAAEVASREQEIAQLEDTRKKLEEGLAKDIKSGNVTVRGEGNMLAVDLADEVLFDSGEATLNEKGQDILRRVCPSLSNLHQRIVEVGGHTDNLPIIGAKREQFPTNWELSTARATTVVRFLQDQCDIPGERLVAAGFSQFRPVDSNRTARGRRHNRRIELVLRPPPPPEH